MHLTGLKVANLLSKILRGNEEENGDYKVEADFVMNGLLHFELKGHTNGVGELYQMAFNAASMQPREYLKRSFAW